MDTSQVCCHWAPMGTPLNPFCSAFWAHNQYNFRIRQISLEEMEECWGHSDFQPCDTAKKFFWFLLLYSCNTWIGHLPFGQNQQMPPEKNKLQKVSSLLFSLSPESWLSSDIFIQMISFKKKLCGFLLQGLSVNSGSLGMSQDKSLFMGKSSRYINETEEKSEQTNYDNMPWTQEYDSF